MKRVFAATGGAPLNRLLDTTKVATLRKQDADRRAEAEELKAELAKLRSAEDSRRQAGEN